MNELLMLVNGASGISSSWNSTTGTPQTSSANKSGKEFSEILKSLQAADAGEADSSTANQVTMTRVMPDGSLLVLLLEGNKIVSETKIPAGLQNLETLLLMGDQMGTHKLHPGSYLASSEAASLLALGH